MNRIAHLTTGAELPQPTGPFSDSEALELSEVVMLAGVVFCHEQMQNAINEINELAEVAGKPGRVCGLHDGVQDDVHGRLPPRRRDVAQGAHVPRHLPDPAHHVPARPVDLGGAAQGVRVLDRMVEVVAVAGDDLGAF